MKKLFLLMLFSVLAGIVLALPSSNTASVICGWSYDFASNPGVTNFIVYYGPNSGTYTNHIDAGTNLTVTISGLVRGQTYFFAGTAQTATLESDYSNESSKTMPNKPQKPASFTVQVP